MKLLKKASKLIVLAAAVNLFAFSVRHVVVGGIRFGPFTKPFKTFIEFPLIVEQALEELSTYPIGHIPIDTSVVAVNQLDYNLYALNGRLEPEGYVYTLSNLASDSVLHTWTFGIEYFKGPPESFSTSLPFNPILLNDGSLIGVLHGSNNLFRLDKKSELVWHQNTRTFHHTINMEDDNHLWACAWKTGFVQNNHVGTEVVYLDDILTKVDVETGEITEEISLAELLIDNGLVSLVHGVTNKESSAGEDLFHLNDIQPIKHNGRYWQKGDLLLSLRHRSMIIHYRPSCDSILRQISGPFLAQHDVDVLSDGRISIFNNNRVATFKHKIAYEIKDSARIKLELNSSNVVVYNFEDSTFSYPSVKLFEEESIYTSRRGLHDFLSNGDLFVESTEEGLIYIIRKGEIIYRSYANTSSDGESVEQPHWIRLYEDGELKNNKLLENS